MKTFKKIPVFILLFTGYLYSEEVEVSSPNFANLQNSTASSTMETHKSYHVPGYLYSDEVKVSSPKFANLQNSTASSTMETHKSYHVPARRSLPTIVVAGVSIALVLLCILIVAVFWYAWKKSQEGSVELNPIPYGEAGVSLRNP